MVRAKRLGLYRFRRFVLLSTTRTCDLQRVMRAPFPGPVLKRPEKPAYLPDVLSSALTPYGSATTGDSVNFRHDPEAEFRRQSVKDVE